MADINREWRAGHERQLSGVWDHAERIKVLDDDGIAAEVIFPDGITEMNTPPFGAGLSLPAENVDPKLQWAGARAHNRWLAEFCAQAPERHAGIAIRADPVGRRRGHQGNPLGERTWAALFKSGAVRSRVLPKLRLTIEKLFAS